MKLGRAIAVVGTVAVVLAVRSRMSRESRRRTTPPDIGFMYAMHDAFRRDVSRLQAAVGKIGTRREVPSTVLEGWDVFQRNLTFHHQAEDDDLWPTLRTRIDDVDERGAIDDMVREHSLIPPALEAVSRGLGGSEDPQPAVDQLATLVLDHLDHEERDVLPLVERRLSDADWHAFLRTERNRRAPRERPEFLCWVLDDTRPEHADAVLGELPPPGRLVYRQVLKPRYDARHLWDTDGPTTTRLLEADT